MTELAQVKTYSNSPCTAGTAGHVNVLPPEEQERIRQTALIIAQVMQAIKSSEEKKPLKEKKVTEFIDNALIAGAKATPGVASAGIKIVSSGVKTAPSIISAGVNFIAEYPWLGYVIPGGILYASYNSLCDIPILGWAISGLGGLAGSALTETAKAAAENAFSVLPAPVQAYIAYRAYEWIKENYFNKHPHASKQDSPVITKETALLSIGVCVNPYVRAFVKSILTSDVVLSTATLCASIDYVNACKKANSWVPKVISDTAGSVNTKIKNAASSILSGMQSVREKIAPTNPESRIAKAVKYLFTHSGKTTALATSAAVVIGSGGLALAALVPASLSVLKLGTAEPVSLNQT